MMMVIDVSKCAVLQWKRKMHVFYTVYLMKAENQCCILKWLFEIKSKSKASHMKMHKRIAKP